MLYFSGKSLTESQYDTSLAISLPLFSYEMPGYRENPSSADLLTQTGIALGALGLLATVATIPLYFGIDGSATVGRSGPLERVASMADSWARAVQKIRKSKKQKNPHTYVSF